MPSGMRAKDGCLRIAGRLHAGSYNSPVRSFPIFSGVSVGA